MPTNCWKTERPIPIQTIGLKKKPPPSRSLKVDLCSLFMASSISLTRASRSILSPSTSSRISRARSCLPTEIKKRGDKNRSSCVRTWRRASISVCRALAPSAASRSRTDVSGSSSTGISSATAKPFGQFLDVLEGPVERLLGPSGRGDGPFGLAGGTAGLPGQPPQLLGHRGLLPVGGTAPLPQLLDPRDALAAPLHGRVLRLGQLLAPHGQFFQLGGRLVDGRLNFEQARRSGGPALREVRAQQIALGGHSGEVGGRE
ncbi:hypothetical protein SALBM311S_11947 [Streptomyces alboniger]